MISRSSGCGATATTSSLSTTMLSPMSSFRTCFSIRYYRREEAKGEPDRKKRVAMKLLLTNDDGIDSPGLEALVDCVAGLGEAIVLAPKQCWSGCGHRVTTDQPLRLV